MKGYASILTTGFLVLFLFLLSGCGRAEAQNNVDTSDNPVSTSGVKVTFIELGSLNCVPCKMMQPVIRQLEENFPKDLRVVFYDVWTKEQAQYAREYGIRVIPTQVFLDADDKEYYRHEGFFPYDDILEILKLKGVTD